MALGHNTSIVRDGLVFYYDMGNTQKSWNGKPTTNLNDNVYFSTTSPYGTYGFSHNNSLTATSAYAPAIGNGNSCIVEATSSVGGTIARAGMTHSAFTNGSTATVSFFAKGIGSSIGKSLHVHAFADSAAGPISTGSTDSFNGTSIGVLTDQWKRYSHTFTWNSATNSYANALNMYAVVFNLQVGERFLVSCPQAEIGNIATPFINGTRSNTQAVLDLTNNHTITASSLTYNANGTFRFNGSSDVLTIPNSALLNPTTGLTIDSWVNFDTDSADFIFEKGDVNTQYSLFSHGTDIVFRTYHSGDASYDTQNPSKSAVGVVNGQWVNVVGSWDGTTKRIYINGELKHSVAKSGNLVTTSLGASVGRFGGNTTGYYFDGSISVVRVYQRGLTATEIKQNFEALRDRYGI